ncbi:MAG: hypothetical protein OXG35_09575 [Acidobacteria bacterium]|nr:hypothetical protein [Acidobacteriota bacterium]
MDARPATNAGADALDTPREAAGIHVATGDLAVLERYGGVNTALKRLRELAAAAAAMAGSTRPAVTSCRAWRSRRVPR